MRPPFATNMIRDDAGRYLVVECLNKYPAWRFPGGKVEPEESPKLAAARELQEELGISLPAAQYFGSGWAEVDSGNWFGFVFAADAEGIVGEIRVLEPEKHGRIAWMFPSELVAHGSFFEAEMASRYENGF